MLRGASNSSCVRQVVVATGTVSMFHVGGYQEASDDSAAALQWEFFIGDRPHAPAVDDAGLRQPMAQIADADRCAVSGKSGQ